MSDPPHPDHDPRCPFQQAPVGSECTCGASERAFRWRYGDASHGVVPDPYGREHGAGTWPITFGPGDDGPGEGCER